jgi:hypothetical protein
VPSHNTWKTLAGLKDDAMSRVQAFRWYKMFPERRAVFEEAQRTTISNTARWQHSTGKKTLLI